MFRAAKAVDTLMTSSDSSVESLEAVFVELLKVWKKTIFLFCGSAHLVRSFRIQSQVQTSRLISQSREFG